MPFDGAIDLDLHAKQGLAMDTLATEVLYGGAAGGGKSWLMRACAVLWAAAIGGLQIYLFRRLRDDLVKNHMEGPKGLHQLLAPWVAAGYVQIVEDEIRFWNDSKIYLCHCKDEKDKFKYQGAEIHVLLIDELTAFTETIYRFLRGRVRMVGVKMPAEYAGRFPRILASSNPGNIGHHWVKAAFIDGAAPLELRPMTDNEGGMLRQYIPARLDDNPSMASDDPNYRARLRGLGSDALVKAMEDGDWNVVAGAYFSNWSTARHVVRPFAIPAHWVRFGSFDWGSARPFSMGWWAVSDGNPLSDGRRYPTGAMIRYREWYGAAGPNEGLRMKVADIAQGIKAREREEPKMDFRVADPACWKSEGGPSIAEAMIREGVAFRQADNSRVSGWSQLRDRLDGDEDAGPMLYAFDTCADFIRTIPALQHDPHKPEDVDSDGEDHAGDEARYACMARPWTRQPKVQLPMRGTADMTMDELWRLGRPQVVGARI